jgi:DNA polymerase I-like protein with 3'-5' exonuclease and polymerase domains
LAENPSRGAVQVGNVLLPDLPPRTRVAYDTETNGLFVDGDPGTDTGDPGSPAARVSVASIAYRDPDTGQMVKHAWGFDQGPHPSKDGRVKRPREGGGVEPLDVDVLLARLAKAGYNNGWRDQIGKSGRVLKTKLAIPWTVDECYEAIGLDSWLRLLRWLGQRDRLVMHHRKFDEWVTLAGPRDWRIRYEWEHNPALRAEFGRNAQRIDRLIKDPNIDMGQYFGANLDTVYDDSGRMVERPVRGIWDTMLVQAFFDPDKPVALKKSAKRLFGVDADADQQALLKAMSAQGTGLTKRYDLTPWRIMEPYAATDPELTLLLAEHQAVRIEEGDHPPRLWEQIDKEFELSRVLLKMERKGVGYDADTSREGAQMLRDRMQQVAQLLPFDPTKLADIRKYYFAPKSEGGLGIRPLKLSEKTNQPSVDEAQMRLLVQGGYPGAEEYDEWSHCKSALGKWYRGWAERTGDDGRLRASFKQCVVEDERAGAKTGGTISGRLAVQRAQLQAIPHNSQLPEVVRDIPVRSLIRAREGHALYEMDLPQGEVRIATVVVNCTAMWDVLDSGLDLHGENAKRIFGIDEEHPQFKDYRGVAKRIVFGTLYGAGIKTLSDQILEYTGMEYSLSETRAAKEAFEREFPQFPEVAYLIQRRADRRLGGPGYVTLIDGRRRWFAPEEFTHKAFNAVIQGDLAQTGKTWMIEVERRLPGIQVLAIHDSVVVEVTNDARGRAQAAEVAAIGKEVYERDYGVRGRKMYFDIVPERWEEKEPAPAKTDYKGSAGSVGGASE